MSVMCCVCVSDSYIINSLVGFQFIGFGYLFIFQDSLEGEPEVLLDLNALSEDGTVALSTYSVSEDAKYLAYALSSSGSDWVTIKVMHIKDQNVEPDTLSWVSNALCLCLKLKWAY